MAKMHTYWHQAPGCGCPLVVICEPETLDIARETVQKIERHLRAIGLLVMDKPTELHQTWVAKSSGALKVQPSTESHALDLLASLPRRCVLVTIAFGDAQDLSWVGSTYGHQVLPVGIGNLSPDLANEELADQIWRAISQLEDGALSISSVFRTPWIGA